MTFSTSAYKKQLMSLSCKAESFASMFDCLSVMYISLCFCNKKILMRLMSIMCGFSVMIILCL
jgi:hypothetical protein